MYEARDSNGMEAALKYAEAKVELLLDRLRVCDLEEVRALQGEIKAHTDTITVLTKPPFDL